MAYSRFQFKDPVLKHLRFCVNDAFASDAPVSIDISISAKTSPVEKIEGSTERIANVSVTLIVGEETDAAPFYVEATEAADFKWSEEDFNEKQSEKLLEQNAVALLISYIRPIISSVTAASRYSSYNLPYIDVTSLKRDDMNK